MNRKNLLLVLSLVGLMYSCTSFRKPELEKESTFSRADFAETKELKHPQEIVLPELLNPASFTVMNDSILVVNNQPNCDYLVELYSLNTLQPLVQLVPKGNGPNEMNACNLSAHTNNSSLFYLQNNTTKTYYTVHLDSILKYRELRVLSKFRYSSEILETAGLCLMNDTEYVGYHMWYVDDKIYGNGISSPLNRYKKNEDSKKGMNDYSYFVAPVNGAQLFMNPATHQIWSIDMHRDQLCIYDDSLHLIATKEGPDLFVPKYTRKETPAPISFIGFVDDLNYRSYTDYFITDNYIYLVYAGDKHFDLENMHPVEIFKMDFKGNLVCNYKVDRCIYSISIDKGENYLYCVARNSVLKEVTLLKYEL